MAAAKLPDGSIKDIPDGTTVGQLADSIGKRLGMAAIVGKVDGKLVDLSFPLTGSHDVQIITERDPEGLYVMRHSTAHVLAQALRHLYGKDVQYTIGPVIDNGFFYDFEFPAGFSQEDLPKVEAEMQKIVNENLPFSRDEVAPPRAKELLHGQNQRFKDEIIDELAAAGETTVSTYGQGDFLDLCRGPHVPATGKIKAFKLLSVAGAYWRGDSNREQLTRIYGTAFFDKKELEAHLKQLEEAKQRDHRVIGQKLGLFAIDDQVGQGLILWKPKGAMVRTVLQNFLQEELFRRGYEIVYTPHIGRVELYKTSGHYPYYKESQFPLIQFIKEGAVELLDSLVAWRDEAKPLSPEQERELVQKSGIDQKKYPWDEKDPSRKYAIARELSLSGEDYLLKPMNCPHHIKIYSSEPRSYRDLPLRLAEFGTVYRFEQSGELSGMTRVRGFTQDDAHIFCTHEQVKGEFRATIELVQFVFKTLGFTDVQVRLSKHDPSSPKFAGNTEVWLQAEQEIRDVLTEMKTDFVEAAGEAAFYGPKVDFLVRDVIGRKWQLGTVQLDYVLPERFKIEYTGPDNRPHRPVMIHRAPFGSMERFMGILIEHFGGAFPLWLAPVQVAVLPISEKTYPYAQEVVETLKKEGMRVHGDFGTSRLNAKIREQSLQKVPYLLIIGEKEAESREVSVRRFGAEEDQGRMALSEFVQRCDQEISTRGSSHATKTA
jgi:threonyl-tRNA synthetase